MSDRLDIVIIMSALDIGGAQRFCLNVSRYFEKKKTKYEIVFLRKGKDDKLKNEFIDSRVKFREMNCKSVVRSLPKLIKYLRHEKPRFMLSSVGNVDFVASIAKLFCPKSKLIIRKANVIFDDQNTRLTRAQLRFEARMCYKMVALTNAMKKDYLKYGFVEEKIVVINNMVDLNYIQNKAKTPGVDLVKADNDKMLVTNARFVPEKRYDILINSFIKLCHRRCDVKLVLIGDGPLFEDVKKMVPEELKTRVVFLGFQNNPYSIMARADLFVFTSDYEGFPNVIIEAMACGLPIVSTNSKTGPREIIQQGVQGYVVERRDVDAIVRRIETILNSEDLRVIMANNSRKRAKEYDVDVIAERYLDLIKG